MDKEVSFRSLAIIDLETTGLPAFECNKTKITQLCIVACSIEHVRGSKNDIPRVLNKLSLCFNPFKLIKLNVSEITGLSNELLEHERKFDEDAADLIINFLSRLQQPLLLVAHNGNRFDYPLLQKQLKALGKSLPESIMCCDSLDIFRKIDEIYEENSITLINGSRMRSWEKLKEETVASMNSEILEIEAILENYQSDNDDDDEDDEEAAVSRLQEEYLSVTSDEKKDELDEMRARQKLNETTPNKPTKPQSKMPPSKGGNENGAKRPMNNVSRELFPNSSASGSSSANGEAKRWPKGKYKLTEIYRRLFDEEPQNSHDAEGDVMALLKCVIASKMEFLEVAQSVSMKFCDVKEL